MSWTIDHRKLYRLPWNLSDNIISWLEPTKKCNIYCEGCYSANSPTSHKTLEQVESDLDVFLGFRNTDCISIAGGDPLTHPDIVEVVRRVAARGVKPIINTNGHALTLPLLRQLKAAGVRGFTFHVDSMQRRPGWTGKSERELNALRLGFAEMVASVGGLSTAFNATVYEHTLDQLPEILNWGRDHINIVHGLVFIAFRSTILDGSVEYYAGGQKVNMGQLVYGKPREGRITISSREVAAVIKEACPQYEPGAYLNGTEQPFALKWLLGMRIGTPQGILGSAGPKFIEASQSLSHLFRGKYLGYVSSGTHRRARLWMWLGLFDAGMRKTAWAHLKQLLRRPWSVWRPLHMQSIMIIQPVDLCADGRASMCDGCPDMTVHNGDLVWSCRLEERLKFGEFVRMVPTEKTSGHLEEVIGAMAKE